MVLGKSRWLQVCLLGFRFLSYQAMLRRLPDISTALSMNVISGSRALELLVRMNEMFDDLKFPQSSVEYRSFRSKRNRPDSEERDESLVSEAIQDINVQAKFVVHVQFRQNATWQGTIEWVEENKTQRFRSALEMLKLMEEALGSGKEIIMNSFLD